MPALDYCHPQIVRALEKDGWRVSDLPLRIKTSERIIYIDIEASQQVNGRQQQIMLAEIKCFPDRESTTRDLYIGIGQYVIYRAVLKTADINIPLYLTLPESVFTGIFDSTVQRAIDDNKIKVVVVNLETETITRWIE